MPYEAIMECNASKGNINTDTIEKTVMEMELEKSATNHSLAISGNSSVAPVIIEELDESAISSMDMDINEFVEAQALQIREVTDVIPNSTLSLSCNSKVNVYSPALYITCSTQISIKIHSISMYFHVKR